MILNREMEEKSFSTEEQVKNKGNGLFRVKAGLFLACSAGIGLLAGFGGAVATARRQGMEYGCLMLLKMSCFL